MDQMVKEVQMMKFKVRPVNGDISKLDFKNSHLVKILWGLGKLDEFINLEFDKIPEKDKPFVSQVVNQMRLALENQVGKALFKGGGDPPLLVELEIFKEYPHKKN